MGPGGVIEDEGVYMCPSMASWGARWGRVEVRMGLCDNVSRSLSKAFHCQVICSSSSKRASGSVLLYGVAAL